MLDIKLLKEDKELANRLKLKDKTINTDLLIQKYDTLCSIKSQVEALRAESNELASKIGRAKQQGISADMELQRVGQIKEKERELTAELKIVEEDFEKDLLSTPNIPDKDLPVGEGPAENRCIKTVGEKPSFDFPFLNHVELGEKHSLFDFERGAKISGSGWAVYKDRGARLEWALLQLMIDTQTRENGFQMIIPPHVVRRKTMGCSGQLPKFENQLFAVRDEDFDHFLIPTAEVPLCGLHMDEILDESQLPLKYTAYTPCFRREAGAHGRGERGLIRTHQFNKVELFAYSTPEQSEALFNEILASAESILQKLGLHYRLMLLSTGDMSFAASRTVDIEVWLPGQNRYYEVSSVSNCSDFQSRRAMIRSRIEGGKPRFVHTLNGSGLATSRLMVALLENYQQKDGSILIPKALAHYFGESILT